MIIPSGLRNLRARSNPIINAEVQIDRLMPIKHPKGEKKISREKKGGHAASAAVQFQVAGGDG